MPSAALSTLDEVRSFYGRLMAAASNSDDPRLETVFEAVRREAFLGPGPWKVKVGARYHETPSANPVHLYQNVLFALDADRGINNGEPFLHAAWLGAVAPVGGETVCHIGAGVGYYTAILSALTAPGGRVQAFEIETDLAERARSNLRSFEGVAVTHGDATRIPLPACNVIYVNAGVAAPPASWLGALRPGGRMIFPWRPAERVGLAVLVRRTISGFAVKPLMPSWFIPCIGASSTDACTRMPDLREAWTVRSLRSTRERPPDDTAVAIYEHVWFSSAAPD